jgi:hypothetical protein
MQQCGLPGAAAPPRHRLRVSRRAAAAAPPSRRFARAPPGVSTTCRASFSFSQLTAEPWDAAPKSWRTFWAVKLAAAVVESSADAVTMRPVECAGLDWPPSAEEARRRVATNVTLYRQNYVLCALACLAAGALRYPALLAGLAAAAVSAVACSDRLLGEAALALDGQLAWNAKRVAGVDRGVLRSGSAAVVLLSLALSPRVRRPQRAAAFSTAARRAAARARRVCCLTRVATRPPPAGHRSVAARQPAHRTVLHPGARRHAPG